MKKLKCLLLSVLLSLGLSGMAAVAAQAETSIDVPAQRVLYGANGTNISDVSFNYADVRTATNTRIFNGGDGKYHVVVYGGVGSCGNTNSAVNSLSKLSAYMDLNQIEINVFDIKNNTGETILDALSANEISSDIKVCKTKGDVKLYNTCLDEANVNGGYTMPLIAYINAQGDIVKVTTGYASSEAIQKNIEEMGMKVDVESSYQVLNITGTVDYAAAYQVLEQLNKDRAANNLGALTMDPGLLESAMQRAAECALYYSHTRPNGESCFSLDSKMYRENIAVGYNSAESVQAAWMKSPGHHANIMAEDNKSVGIGVFGINGVYYWVQCFGNMESVNTVQPANTTRSYSIQTVQNLVDPYFKQDNFEFNIKGSVAQFEVWVKNKGWEYASVKIDASSYDWSSDNSQLVINSDGKLAADKWGLANIKAVNKNNSIYNLLGSVHLYTHITVSNPGIYVFDVNKDEVIVGMTYTTSERTDMEYAWYASKDGVNWTCVQDWKENNEWLRWNPGTFGEYQLKGVARVQGNQKSVVEATTSISFHPYIKGKCQMPYEGEGGGYLIGVETYDNPGQSYTYEMLILDCTLLAQGKDAWVYSTGKCRVGEGSALWTIWQPLYGYYWTLFRVYDADGVMIDEVCYGFENI